MSGIVIFGIFAIVLNPVGEMGVVPTRELRGVFLTHSFRASNPMTWNIILVSSVFIVVVSSMGVTFSFPP
jgi:hypothetical protein